jgi:hypothetical protein
MQPWDDPNPRKADDEEIEEAKLAAANAAKCEEGQ